MIVYLITYITEITVKAVWHNENFKKEVGKNEKNLNETIQNSEKYEFFSAYTDFWSPPRIKNVVFGFSGEKGSGTNSLKFQLKIIKSQNYSIQLSKYTQFQLFIPDFLLNFFI